MARRLKNVLLVIFGFLFLFLAFTSPFDPAAIAQQPPMALVHSGTERVMLILKESRTGQSPSLRGKRDEILAVVSEYFNFEEMAKRALGRPWKDQSPENRSEFVSLFKQLLFNTYVSRLENYSGSNEQILYDLEKLDGNYALVKTHVVYQGSENISIEYRLHMDGGQWKVYDVVVEGISFVDNYRGQFGSILAHESFESLLTRLRQKAAEPN